MRRATSELPRDWGPAACIQGTLEINPKIGIALLEAIALKDESIVRVARNTSA